MNIEIGKHILFDQPVSHVCPSFLLNIQFNLFFQNVCQDTLDSIVPNNVPFRFTETDVKTVVIAAAMRRVMCREVV